MAGRLQLHEELCDILQTKNVYFQPPESVKMTYPCIRYSKAEPDARHANDKVYKNVSKYEGIVIDYDPDSAIPDSLLEYFQMCSLGKAYVSNNLNHFPFTLYY